MGYNIYDEICEMNSDELEKIIIFCKRIIDEKALFEEMKNDL